MSPRVKVLSWPLLALSALLVGAAFLPESLAQPQQKAPKVKPVPTGADVQFAEADVMRKAYVLLAGANHDYAGHRVKAMKDVHAGLKILDAFVVKNGTAAQKAATKQGKAAVAAAVKAAKAMKMVSEPQPASDLQLRQAGELLAELRNTLATYQQQNLLVLADTAIGEIKTALTIR